MPAPEVDAADEPACHGLSEALAQISASHQRFLEVLSGDIVQALRTDNERLAQTSARLARELASSKPAGISASGWSRKPLPGSVSSASDTSDAAPLASDARPRSPAVARHSAGTPAHPETDVPQRDASQSTTYSLLTFGSQPPARPHAAFARTLAKKETKEPECGDSQESQHSAWTLPRTGPRTQSATRDISATMHLPGTLDHKTRSKDKSRLRCVLGVAPNSDVVSKDMLVAALFARCQMSPVDGAEVWAVFKEIEATVADDVPSAGKNVTRLASQRSAASAHSFGSFLFGAMAARLSLSNADVRHTATKTMSFDMFLDILFIRNLKEYIAPDKQELVAEAVRSLLTPHWHEVISEATRDALDVDFLSEWSRFDVYMNILILVVVFINLLAAGISLDYSPGHWGWFALEIGCLLVFVAEVVTKLRTDGVRKYFLGRQRRLHMLDVGVMILSFIEVCISIYVLHVPARQDLPTGVWLAALGRILKVACVVRLMKFVQSPALTDLVNMLLGFMIGFPVLLWVMVLFCATLLILGFLGRLFLGPAPGQDMVATCGNPDTILDQGDATCKVHHMYGEVYFGSLATSCFTAFRFMLGDFATRGGRSMLVAFSNGYGNVFNIAFIVYMVSVIFGLFNIITAIFVDRTTSGLKRESEQRKYIRQYGRAYVQDRLRELVTRVSELWRKFPRSSMHGRRLMSAKREGSARSQSGRVSIVDFSLDEEEFRAVMKDARVHELMTELDVATANPASFFNAFSPDNGGAVTLRGMVEGILRLRGEPHKSDVIASAMSIQALHDKFDRFALMQSPNGVNMS